MHAVAALPVPVSWGGYFLPAYAGDAVFYVVWVRRPIR